PRRVELVAPGTRIDLAGQVFFGSPAEQSPLLPWLSDLVRSTLRLPDGETVHDKTLAGLGVESLQAVALQYQIPQGTGADTSRAATWSAAVSWSRSAVCPATSTTRSRATGTSTASRPPSARWWRGTACCAPGSPRTAGRSSSPAPRCRSNGSPSAPQRTTSPAG